MNEPAQRVHTPQKVPTQESLDCTNEEAAAAHPRAPKSHVCVQMPHLAMCGPMTAVCQAFRQEACCL
eukprot:1157676-Pelagomonas_calceolata.AAC.2